MSKQFNLETKVVAKKKIRDKGITLQFTMTERKVVPTSRLCQSILIKQPEDKKKQKQIKTITKIYMLRYELVEGAKST